MENLIQDMKSLAVLNKFNGASPKSFCSNSSDNFTIPLQEVIKNYLCSMMLHSLT